MFYLTTHSTHFIHGYMASEHMVKDHSGSERGNPLPQQGFFYMHHPTYRVIHTTAFVTSVVEHWLELEITANKVICLQNCMHLLYMTHTHIQIDRYTYTHTPTYNENVLKCILTQHWRNRSHSPGM